MKIASQSIRKIILTLMPVILSGFLFAQCPAAVMPTGSGTAADPYLVASFANLRWLSENTAYYNKYYLQTEDIDASCTSSPSYNGGLGFLPIGNPYYGYHFSGTYDGGGKKIENLYINRFGGYGVALFGSLINGGLLKNIRVLNAYVRGYRQVALLAGESQMGKIDNCVAEGSVEGREWVGGLTGFNYYPGPANVISISNCSVTVNMTSYMNYYFAGGLIGLNVGNVNNCHTAGTINGAISYTGQAVGGFAGFSDSYTNIMNCSSSVNLVQPTNTLQSMAQQWGGFIGINNGKISNCYATGNILTNYGYETGGFAGFADNYSSLINCYATGNVRGYKYVGGFAGHINFYASTNYFIRNCYASGTVTGAARGANSIGGFAGFCEGNPEISDCYATGNIVFDIIGGDAGGFAGYMKNGNIKNCYSTGSVNSIYSAGGLIGRRDLGTVTNSFWDLNTSGKTNSAGGTGKTTCEMKTTSTFTNASWNFPATWTQNNSNNNGYPALALQGFTHTGTTAAPSFIACPERINTTTSPGLCSTLIIYNAEANGSPAPDYSYEFSGATTGSGTGTGSGSSFNKGSTSVTITATNNCGSATCRFDIVVEDREQPVANCKNLTLSLSGGTAELHAADINNNSTDNCGIASMEVSKSSFTCSDIGNNTVTLTVTDLSGNTSSCQSTVTILGEIPQCQIVSVPENNIYTGGVPTNLYLGYGPQNTTLEVSAPASGEPYTYSWSGGTLSNYNTSNPVFHAVSPGIFTFTVIVTNQYGCSSFCSITICVRDVRVPGTSGPNAKIYVCHQQPGNPGNPQTLAVSINAVATHLESHPGDKLGSCNMESCEPPLITKRSKEMIETAEKELAINVSPNPSSGNFVFRIAGINNYPVTVRVIDVTGKVMHVITNGSKEFVLSLGNKYPPGVYFAELSQGNYRKVIKLVKL